MNGVNAVELLQRRPLFDGLTEADLTHLAGETRSDRFAREAAIFAHRRR
jgi:hypothetical protein